LTEINGFNAFFTVSFRSERHPPHILNVAALPCESQNTENVTLQRDITKENCSRCII